MPEEKSSPKSSPKPDTEEVEVIEEESSVEEVEYQSYDDAVIDLLNEIASLASPYLQDEQIGMITIVAVSADGSYSQAHEISKLPESAGDDEQEKARLERVRRGSRLHTLTEMQKHKTRLLDGLKKNLEELDA